MYAKNNKFCSSKLNLNYSTEVIVVKKEEKFKKFMGVDVSKDKLDVYCSWDGKSVTVRNNKTAIRSFIKYLKVEKEDLLVLIDLTGGYERTAARYFYKEGYNVHLAEGRKVKNYTIAIGQNAKTDKIDAKILAEYGEHFQEKLRLYKYNETEQKIEQLKALISNLQDIELIIQQEKNRLESSYDEDIERTIKKIITMLIKQQEQIMEKIQVIINDTKELKDKQEVLLKQKGIGLKSATILVSLLPELGKANRREIAALVGVAPYPKDSGKIQGRGRTRVGRKEVKKLMYMCALVAIKYDKKMKMFYERLITKAKPKMVAIVAVIRKMLTILNARCKAFYNGTEFVEYL